MEDREMMVREKSAYYVTKSDFFSWKDAYSEVKNSILKHLPIILFGPPGTGKTKMLNDIQYELSKENKIGNYEVVQFHKKFTYEDFIEGYAPTENGFEKRDGVFKKFVSNASSKDIDLFIIDEINRAEITITLGELMYLIEDRKIRRLKTSHFSEYLQLPENLSLVGTMNTADRNIATIDFALRRRFKFIPLYPDYSELLQWLQLRGFNFDDFSTNEFSKAASVINMRITSNRLLGRNMQLGQAMWVPKGEAPIESGDIIGLFQFEIIPQLETYLGFGNESLLSEILNPNVAEKYLRNMKIDFSTIIGLVRDLTNDKQF